MLIYLLFLTFQIKNLILNFKPTRRSKERKKEGKERKEGKEGRKEGKEGRKEGRKNQLFSQIYYIILAYYLVLHIRRRRSIIHILD